MEMGSCALNLRLHLVNFLFHFAIGLFHLRDLLL